MWVQFIGPCLIDQWIHCFFIGPCSLQSSMNSLKILWNHFTYINTFCAKTRDSPPFRSRKPQLLSGLWKKHHWFWIFSKNWDWLFSDSEILKKPAALWEFTQLHNTGANSIWGSVQSLRLFTKNQAIIWLRKINTSQLIDRTNISDAGRRVHSKDYICMVVP